MSGCLRIECDKIARAHVYQVELCRMRLVLGLRFCPITWRMDVVISTTEEVKRLCTAHPTILPQWFYTTPVDIRKQDPTATRELHASSGAIMIQEF